jgi:hypothetical protein
MTTYLPKRNEAVLDIRKIEDYCLNPSHPRGRHKARVFREALGLQRSDAGVAPGRFAESRRLRRGFPGYGGRMG